MKYIHTVDCYEFKSVHQLHPKIKLLESNILDLSNCMNVCLWYLILGYFGTFGVHWGKSCVLLHSLGYFGVPYGQGSLSGLNKCHNLNPTIHPAMTRLPMKRVYISLWAGFSGTHILVSVPGLTMVPSWSR